MELTYFITKHFILFYLAFYSWHQDKRLWRHWRWFIPAQVNEIPAKKNGVKHPSYTTIGNKDFQLSPQVTQFQEDHEQTKHLIIVFFFSQEFSIPHG